MTITDVRVKKTYGSGKLKASASITIDGVFVVHGIRVIDNDGCEFVAMPSKKDKEGTFKDIAHPLNKDTRSMVQKAILDAYHNCPDDDAE